MGTGKETLNQFCNGLSYLIAFVLVGLFMKDSNWLQFPSLLYGELIVMFFYGFIGLWFPFHLPSEVVAKGTRIFLVAVASVVILFTAVYMSVEGGVWRDSGLFLVVLHVMYNYYTRVQHEWEYFRPHVVEAVR